MNITELFAHRIRIALSFIFAGSCCYSAAQAFTMLEARLLAWSLLLFGCSLLALGGLILIWTTRTRPRNQPQDTAPGGDERAGGASHP